MAIGEQINIPKMTPDKLPSIVFAGLTRGANFRFPSILPPKKAPTSIHVVNKSIHTIQNLPLSPSIEMILTKPSQPPDNSNNPKKASRLRLL